MYFCQNKILVAPKLSSWYSQQTLIKRIAFVFVLFFIINFFSEWVKYRVFFQEEVRWRSVWFDASFTAILWTIVLQFRSIKALFKNKSKESVNAAIDHPAADAE